LILIVIVIDIMDMKNLKKAFGMYKKQKEKQKEEMNKIIKKNLDEHKQKMELYYDKKFKDQSELIIKAINENKLAK